jgi:hypothetical protein
VVSTPVILVEAMVSRGSVHALLPNRAAVRIIPAVLVGGIVFPVNDGLLRDCLPGGPAESSASGDGDRAQPNMSLEPSPGVRF